MKRLKDTTGIVTNYTPKNLFQSDSRMVRQGILVHAGANGSPVEFQSLDGPIRFDTDRIKDLVKSHNLKMKNLAEFYGGLESMPDGAFPPVLDQHSDDSTNRIIGRLNSLLSYQVRDVPGVGKNVPCACADITFLGEDTVKKVQDGRLYHLSIGIDETSNTLLELSSVITPAASGAMLLKKGKPGGAMELEKAKKRAELKAEAKKQLAHVKNVMSELNNGVKLQAKKKQISSRLSSAMQAGKLSPAEMKQINMDQALNLSDDALAFAYQLIDNREPLDIARQYGTSKASSLSQLAEGLKKDDLSGIEKRLGGYLDERYKGRIPDEAKTEDVKGPTRLAEQAYEELKKSLEAKNVKHLQPGQVNPGIIAPEVAGQDPTLEEQNDAMTSRLNEVEMQLSRLMQIVAQMAEGDDDEEEGAEDDGSSELGEDEKAPEGVKDPEEDPKDEDKREASEDPEDKDKKEMSDEEKDPKDKKDLEDKDEKDKKDLEEKGDEDSDEKKKRIKS